MQAVLLPFHSLWLWIGYHTKYVPPCQVFLILGTAYAWLAVVCCQTGICTANMCRLPPRQNSYVYSATPFLFTVSKCHSFTQDKRPSASRRALMDFEGGQPICSHIDYAQDFHFLSSFCLVPIVPPSLFLGDKILPRAAIPTFFAAQISSLSGKCVTSTQSFKHLFRWDVFRHSHTSFISFDCCSCLQAM